MVLLSDFPQITVADASLPLQQYLPSWLPELLAQQFILAYWQWIAIFIIVLLGVIVDKWLTWILTSHIRRWKKKQSVSNIDDGILRPVGITAMAIVWWGLLGLIGLPTTGQQILAAVVQLLVSVSLIWGIYRIVDIFHLFLMEKAKRTANRFDDLLVPMLTKSLKAFVIIIGIIFAADNLNIDVSSLLAGLGLGGLAFALAAKDLLGNFFGSLTVLLDRPFQIGDWVLIDDVEGMVETVGFRSTRIRTFYNSLITLPNATLTNTKIDNMGARRYRRMKTQLGLTYDTPPEKIEAFCEGIRTLVLLHPYMRKDYYQIFFNEYNASSLGILVYVFWETPDWNMELRERHRFLLDILRLAKKLQVEFAYPTQTLYLKQSAAEMAMTDDVALNMTNGLGKQFATDIVDNQHQADTSRLP